VLFVVVAGCGGDGGMSPIGLADASGASDAASSADGAPAPGLILDWADMPSLPGMVSPMVTVTSAKFFVKKLEIISDGGATPQTTVDDAMLVWNATTQVLPTTFFGAPAPAIYSKVRIHIDKGSSETPAVEILGTTTATGSSEPFKITSTEKLDLEVDGYNVQLAVGDSKVMTVLVGLDAALANVNWAALPTPSNVRTLDDNSMSARDAFFEDLETAFTAP